MTDHGSVNAQLTPTIRLRLRGPTGSEFEQEAVIDTGYTGKLTLPMSVVTSLGLPVYSGGKATLADGTVVVFVTFTAEVYWGGTWVSVVVSALGDEVLLGMGLLAGRGLWVEAHPGGVVEVRPLATNGG